MKKLLVLLAGLLAAQVGFGDDLTTISIWNNSKQDLVVKYTYCGGDLGAKCLDSASISISSNSIYKIPPIHYQYPFAAITEVDNTDGKVLNTFVPTPGIAECGAPFKRGAYDRTFEIQVRPDDVATCINSFGAR
jgi:hypothetical protein